MAQITYDDKVYLNENASVPAINKVQDIDMNEIKSVINGINDGTDVVDNLVVGSVRTKNMFDTNNVFNGFINTSNTSLTYETDGKRYSGYVKVEPSTTYIVSKSAGHSFRIATTTNYPTNNTTYNYTEADHTATSITITTGANDNYLVFFFYAEQNGDTGGYMSMANTIQVEKGSTVTSYSPYQNLNPNNNSYLLNEVKIGSWIDGKPLYRRVWNLSSITSSNSNLVDISSMNIREVIKVYGMLNTNNSQHFPMPLTDSSSNYSVVFATATVIRGRAVFGSGSFSSGWVALEYTKSTD